MKEELSCFCGFNWEPAFCFEIIRTLIVTVSPEADCAFLPSAMIILLEILQRLAILGSRRRSLSDSNALIVVKSPITPSSELSISILT